MSDDTEDTHVFELQRLIAEQQREILDLKRHNQQLREAIDALMQPAPSELLEKNLAHPSRK